MMQIASGMIEQIRRVLPNLSDTHQFEEIPGMGGYFVTYRGNDIPENAGRVAEIGIDGSEYLVYALKDIVG